jgi:lipopolysaccharide export LptBFGC system permease protein LptF
LNFAASGFPNRRITSPVLKGGIAMTGALFFASFLLGAQKNEGHDKKRPNRNSGL